jgi:hypothetical protein
MPFCLVGKLSWFDLMFQDVRGSHGWDVDAGKGQLIDKLSEAVLAMEAWNGNVDQLEAAVADISHLCLDACTIGQVCPELWGIRDDMIDLASEFVLNKQRNAIFPVSFKTEIGGFEAVRQEIGYTAAKYRRNHWFRYGVPMPWMVAEYTRDAVSRGAGLARAFIRLEFELA